LGSVAISHHLLDKLVKVVFRKVSRHVTVGNYSFRKSECARIPLAIEAASNEGRRWSKRFGKFLYGRHDIPKFMRTVTLILPCNSKTIMESI
jgi:hypothetical protein